MELVIKGDAKEIAGLVAALQEQQEGENVSLIAEKLADGISAQLSSAHTP